jgi:hypothetical protein
MAEKSTRRSSKRALDTGSSSDAASVAAVLDTRPDWSVVARRVCDAFLHVASRKLLEQWKGAAPEKL